MDNPKNELRPWRNIIFYKRKIDREIDREIDKEIEKDKPEKKFEPMIPPEKSYFRIGEVSEITGVPAYVLRFWETEFTKIKPKRASSGQRMYRKSDVELVFKIKRLLHEKKYTIQGAKQFLLSESAECRRGDKASATVMEEIRSELVAIRQLLD